MRHPNIQWHCLMARLLLVALLGLGGAAPVARAQSLADCAGPTLLYQATSISVCQSAGLLFPAESIRACQGPELLFPAESLRDCYGPVQIGFDFGVVSDDTIVFDMAGDLWLLRQGESEPVQLTSGPDRDSAPRFSPDGTRIAFCSDFGGPFSIWTINPDGSNRKLIDLVSEGNPFQLDWSPSGDAIAVADGSDTLVSVAADNTGLETLLQLPLYSMRRVAWGSSGHLLVAFHQRGEEASMKIGLLSPPYGLENFEIIHDDDAWPTWNAAADTYYLATHDKLMEFDLSGTLNRELQLTASRNDSPSLNHDESQMYVISDSNAPSVNSVIQSVSLADGTSLVVYESPDRINALDVARVAVGTNAPPARPVNLDPADGAVDQGLQPTLTASAFSDPDGDTHAYSQWQVRRADLGYDTAVIDEVTTRELTTYEVWDPTALVPGQTYAWRVRYFDSELNPSFWSAETTFATVAPVEGPDTKVLIVAGGDPGDTNALASQTRFLAGFAHRLSNNRRIAEAQIKLLSSWDIIPAEFHNGVNDLLRDGPADLATVSAELDPVNGFAAGEEPLILFFVDHGSSDGNETYFHLLNSERLAASVLDQQLDALQAVWPDKTIIAVFDFCFSGAFVEACAPTAGQKRVCISGSTNASLAVFSGEIANVSFSSFLFNSLAAGADFRTAFRRAREAVLALRSAPEPYGLQVPWLEDDGDGVISTKWDGALASDLFWGSTEAYGATPPEITGVSPDSTINPDWGVNTFELFVELAAGHTITEVWALITPPNADVVDVDGEGNPAPITRLTQVNLASVGGNRWSAELDLTDPFFSQPGEYVITFYAAGHDGPVTSGQMPGGMAGQIAQQTADTDAMISNPRQITLTITGDPLTTYNSARAWSLYE